MVRDGRSSEVRRAIVLWDKVGGELGLSKAVADNLDRYTQALLEITRSSGQRSERERLLREDTAVGLPTGRGRRGGVCRGQAGERVSHGRGPADIERRL